MAIAQAQQDELHGSASLTYNSLHVWRGFLTYGSHSSINPMIDLDLMGSGFGASVEGHRANSSGYELGERWDYTLYYQGRVNEEDVWATNYRIGYVYYNYPDLSSHTRDSADLQEFHGVLSFPKLLGVERLVPSYVLVKLWPSNSDSPVGADNANGGTASGFAHIFMLDYGVPISGLTSETPEQILNLHFEMVFNDGVDPRANGGYTDSDWTNAVIGASTDFNLGNDVFLTPGLFYQITMEDNGPINGVSPDHDITWASLTLKYKF